MHFTRLRRAFWQAFLHGQFSIAKAAAYSSILTLFPAFLIVTSLLEASNATEGFVRRWLGPPAWPKLNCSHVLPDQAASCHAHYLLSFPGYVARGFRRDDF